MIGNFEKKLLTIKQVTYQDSTDQDNQAIGVVGYVSLVDALGNAAPLGGGAGGGNDTHTTASGQITATANAGGKTITLGSLPFTLTAEMVAGGSIKKISSTGAVSSIPLTNVTVSGNVITLGDADDFVSGDEVSVILTATEKGYDENQGVFKHNVENPLWDHRTSAESLVSASDIGATDGIWLDQGAEIDCKTYNRLTIWVNYTDNNSTGGELQVLCKHESGGSDEYKSETSTDYQKTLVADDKIKYDFSLKNTTPYVQIQTRAADVDDGGGTIGTVTLHITKGYE